MTLMTPWLRTTNLHSKEELLNEAASIRDIGKPTQAPQHTLTDHRAQVARGQGRQDDEHDTRQRKLSQAEQAQGEENVAADISVDK